MPMFLSRRHLDLVRVIVLKSLSQPRLKPSEPGFPQMKAALPPFSGQIYGCLPLLLTRLEMSSGYTYSCCNVYG